MAFKVHKIHKYNYAFDARAGSPGRLQLWGDKKRLLKSVLSMTLRLFLHRYFLRVLIVREPILDVVHYLG